MKIKELFEAEEKSLVGMTISNLTDFAGKKWQGNFICSDKQLTSLKGSPSEVSGDFHCSKNQLTSLINSPEKVDGDFNCSKNQLTSLNGAPSFVGGDFFCMSNNLTSFEGAPSSVGGEFFCMNNKLKSLKGIHKHIKEINGNALLASKNPISSHILGVFKIKGLETIQIDNKDVQKIVNKYLSEGDILECQQELIEAGFEEYARL